MTDVDAAIKKIDHWLAETGVSESRLGLLGAANAKAIPSIRAGTAQVATLRNILSFIETRDRRR